MKVVNDIELYSFTNSTVFKYRKEAKCNPNINIDTLERKFTSIIMNAIKVKNESEEIVKYKFGGCYLYVNEKLKLIVDIGWFDKEHSSWGLNRERAKNFIDTNLKLGLSKKGNRIIDNTSIN